MNNKRPPSPSHEPFTDRRIWVDVFVPRARGGTVVVTLPLQSLELVTAAPWLQGVDLGIRRLPPDPSELTADQIARMNTWRRLETIGEEDVWQAVLEASTEEEG